MLLGWPAPPRGAPLILRVRKPRPTIYSQSGGLVRVTKGGWARLPSPTPFHTPWPWTGPRPLRAKRCQNEQVGPAWARPAQHSLCLLALVVGAPPRVPPRLPLGQGQVWQEGRQGALDLVGLPTQRVLRRAVVGTLAVEADVVGWRQTDTGVSRERHVPRPPSRTSAWASRVHTVRRTRAAQISHCCDPVVRDTEAHGGGLSGPRPHSCGRRDGLDRNSRVNAQRLKRHNRSVDTPRREGMSANRRSDEGLACGTCQERLKQKKLNNPTDAREGSSTDTAKAQGANRDVGRCSTPSVVRGMRWSPQRRPFLATRLGLVKRTGVYRCCGGWGETGAPDRAGGAQTGEAAVETSLEAS